MKEIWTISMILLGLGIAHSIWLVETYLLEKKNDNN
jgi:predicted RND superfamily exporter protein